MYTQTFYYTHLYVILYTYTYDIYCVCMGCVHSMNERSCGEFVFLQEKTNGALGPQLPLWLAGRHSYQSAAPCTCCRGSTSSLLTATCLPAPGMVCGALL